MASVTPARHATWDPSLRRWSYGRELLERRLRLRWWVSLLDVVIVGSAIALLLGGRKSVFGLFLIQMRFGILATKNTRRLRLSESMVQRLEVIGNENLIPVDVQIRQRGLATGSDCGLMLFDKDLLRFEGRYCKFAIASTSATESNPGSAHEPGVARLRLDCAPEPMTLTISAYPHGRTDDGSDRRNLLDKELKYWLAAPRRPGSDEVLPPAEPDPNAVHAVSDAYAGFATAVALMVVVAGCIVWSQNLSGGERLLASTILAIFGTVLTLGSRMMLKLASARRAILQRLHRDAKALAGGPQPLPDGRAGVAATLS